MSERAETTWVHETAVEVRSHELDSFGHANHAVFLNYLEHGRFKTLEAHGFSYAVMAERGWGVYVVRVEVDYLAEAMLGDRLLIRTGAEPPKRSSIVIVQEIVRETDPAVVVARARVTAVWVGPNRRPIRVPEEVHVLFGYGD